MRARAESIVSPSARVILPLPPSPLPSFFEGSSIRRIFQRISQSDEINFDILGLLLVKRIRMLQIVSELGNDLRGGGGSAGF